MLIFRLKNSNIQKVFLSGQNSRKMEIIQPQIQKYLEHLIPDRDEVLTEMEELAKREGFPIVGPLVGRFLAQLTIMTKARRILELGSGFGYSAYWFAKAMGRNGTVICTDTDPGNRDRAIEFFKRAKLHTRVNFRVGDALEIMDQLNGKFDIIMNDINKTDYPLVFRKAVPRLKRGGLLISDNAIWHGRVVDKNPDASTKGILEFNRLIYESPDLLTTIIPLRDGISVSLKISDDRWL